MKLAVFSSKPYDKKYISDAHATRYGNDSDIEIDFHEYALCPETASLVHDVDAVCVFVNDILTAPVLKMLYAAGVRAILLRCADYGNVDVQVADQLGIFIANVPSYSPESAGEFVVSLILTLNRKTHHAYNRIQEGDSNLIGLLGNTLHGMTVGIIGTGRIGIATARILKGFGCRLLAFDPNHAPNFEQELDGKYLELNDLLPQCDIISLHCPLLEKTHHIIDESMLAKMKPGAMLVNISHGGLIDIKAVIAALESKHLGSLALDIPLGKGVLFDNDLLEDFIESDELIHQMAFQNVLICNNQAFFTEEALQEISENTLKNLDDFVNRMPCKNSLFRDENTLLWKELHLVRNI